MPLEPAHRKGRQFLNPVPTQVGGPSMIFKALPRLFSGRTNDRQPRKPLGPFRTDTNIYTKQPPSGLRVTWMGHSTSLIEIDGVRILVDPVWDERAAPTNWAGPKRFFPPPLALSDLPLLDAVLISHDHYDHLGAHTIRALSQLPAAEKAKWIVPLEVGPVLQQFGIPAARCTELNWLGRTQIGAIELTALPARHFSGRSLFNRFQTLWASFALIGPNHRLYYGADSGEWSGFHEIGQQFGPFDLTMLEIGASDPLWADIHMGPEGAARSFRALGNHGLLMPIHWGLFNLALHPWIQPIEAISSIKDLKLWSPPPGVPSDVIANQELRSNWWR